MASVDELIERLKDFRTRSAAKNELLDMREQAVGPLIKALDGINDRVRWTAITILGELGARDAVPKLVEAVNDADVHSAAVEALEHITGEGFGDDYDAWKRWLGINGEGETPRQDADEPALSDGNLIRKAVYGTDISAEGSTLRVPFGDRHQDVMINFKPTDSSGTPLLVVYTRCGPAKPKLFEWALRQNVRMSAGAIAIADVKGKPEFVIVDVLVRSAATPDQLIESVRRVARKGDELEAALSESDTF